MCERHYGTAMAANFQNVGISAKYSEYQNNAETKFNM